MEEHPDPGWKPALPVAVGMLLGRGPSGSILLVMRAVVVILSVVAGLTTVAVLAFGAGTGEANVDPTTARIGLSAMVGAAVIAISLIGKAGPDVDSEAGLAASLFQTTMRRVLAAAGVGPGGFFLSWASADATYVIFGSGLALLLMAVASPTSDRLDQWQADVVEAGSALSVRAALARPWR